MDILSEIEKQMDSLRRIFDEAPFESMMYLTLAIDICLNDDLQSLDRYMSYKMMKLNCNLCCSSMVTNFLPLSLKCNFFICDKCVEGVNNYKARICNKCVYPNVQQLHKEIKDLFSESTCDICHKYIKEIKKQRQTDFFKIDFLRSNDSDSYIGSYIDSD